MAWIVLFDAGGNIADIAKIAGPILAIGIAYGLLSSGQKTQAKNQDEMAVKFDGLQKMIGELPETYVTIRADQQRQKWLDERDEATKGLLKDIKDELKGLRK